MASEPGVAMVLCGILLCASASDASGVALHGTLLSREDGQPLPYGVVRISDRNIRAESNRAGEFVLHGVLPGDHVLAVSLIGYRPRVIAIHIAEADSVATIRIELEPVAFALREISIRAPARAGPGMSTEVLSRDEIAGIPATGDDLFRAVQTLPGVISTDISASFRVRGGATDETLVRMDGFNLPEPYHLRDVGGALSVVSLDAVSHARLQAGGLPARYAEHLSGALEIHSESELPRRSVARIRAGVAQASAQLSGPIGGKGSYLLALRHGLLDAVFRSYRVNPGVEFVPDFDDVLALARLSLAPAQDVELFFLGARDDLFWNDSYDGNDTVSRQRNMTAGAQWSARWSDRLNHRVVLSADYLDRRRLLAYTGRDDNLTRAVRARVEESVTVTRSQTLELGAAWEWERTRLGLREVDVDFVGGLPSERLIAVTRGTAMRRRGEGFVSLHSRWGERISTTAGLNAGYDNYDWGLVGDSLPSERVAATFGLGPRLSVAHRVGNQVTVRAAVGVLRQPAFLNNLDIVQIKLPLGRIRRANELIAGVDFALHGWPFRLEGYHRWERGYAIPLRDRLTIPSPSPTVAAGRSRGLELFARIPAGGWLSGWASYSLARAVWKLPGREVPRDFDERHAVLVSLSAPAPAGLKLSTTARYHSGDPYTSNTWESPDQRYRWVRVSGPEMGARYPDYFRLDVRVSHPIRGAIPGSFYVELINVTDHRNIFLYTWRFDPVPGGGSTPGRQTVELFPRVPSAGFEIRF